MASLAVHEARLHIEDIRRQKFSIGSLELNPLVEDLHHAVTSLSAELYTKDVHFLMELIQNAEDNKYTEGTEPTLEFFLTEKDITETGAPATLLVFNNEVGFSKMNMESLCGVGRSTKKGRRREGFIGEKGIGFKSVFLVSSQPYIFSNGYQVKFNETPISDCGIGYIVPEWVDEQSIVSSIQNIYGAEKNLPTTTLVLPLRTEKVEGVKTQLSELHPEVLLFLNKIEKLSVRVNHGDPDGVDIVSVISIASETDYVFLKDKNANSYVLHLSVKENDEGPEETCRYFMWRQAFPVRPENKVCTRKDVDEWIISLAFPFGKRLTRGTSSVGVYAFLPTAMVTKFPFVIHADFMLASSRETILLDSKWNLGILNCVSSAFLNAFSSCAKEASAFSSLAQAFEFLPVETSSVAEFNRIRESIKIMLQNEPLVPCETFTGKIYYCKPDCAIKVPRKFQELLFKVKEEGISLDGLSSLKKLVLHASLCDEQYSRILEYIGVASLGNASDWFEDCFKCCNFVLAASEETYIELLCFVADYANYCGLMKIPLLKYVSLNGKVELRASASKEIQILYASETQLHVWLSKCNEELGYPNNMYFFPCSTQEALRRHPKMINIHKWLASNADVKVCSADEYFNKVCRHINDTTLANKISQFLYHSYSQKFITESYLFHYCCEMPVVDGSGCLRLHRTATLVPASRSKWSKLFGRSNPFLCQKYVDLGDVYAERSEFAGCITPEKKLLNFLTKHTRALDLPELKIPDKAFRCVFFNLPRENAFLLLDWIRFQNVRGSTIPKRFLDSIQYGRWIKTCSDFNYPKRCILLDKSCDIILEIGRNVLEAFSIVDEEFYANQIVSYANELRLLGVRFGSDDVQRLLLTRFKSLASSEMKKECAISLLMLIRILKERDNLNDEWLEIMKDGKWLRTSQGYFAPKGSVLLESKDIEAEVASKFANLYVIDEKFYEGTISSFSSELKLLDVMLDQKEIYASIAESFTFPSKSSSLTTDCGLLILKCIRYTGSLSSGFHEKVVNQAWLKTNVGFKRPSDSVLADLDRASLLLVVELPIIDEAFYREAIRSYIPELKSIGVATDNDSILKMVCNQIKFLLSSNSLTAVNVFLLLNYIRESSNSVAQELKIFLVREKWLKTRQGYRAPGEAILFTERWGTVSLFVDLPFIDDSFYSIGIYKYKDELKMMGVITDFKEGALFLAIGLKQPIEPALITIEGTFSILEGIRSLMSEYHDQQILVDFLDKLKNSKWLKTQGGWRDPENCVLFDVACKSILKKTDAPMIDEQLYGAQIYAYRYQLKAIGVGVDPLDVCALLYRLLPSYTETTFIRRIYKFLSECRFQPEFIDQSSSKLWIPSSANEGEWVNSQLCVLHDRENLFTSHLHALENYYDKKLLPMFVSVYGVLEFPSLNSYLQLWNSWALRENNQVTASECCSFWGYILQNWNPTTEEQLKQNLIKLPVHTCTGDEVHVVSKQACFLPDDLQLKKIFLTVGTLPLFLWFPKSFSSSSVCPRKLYEVYNSLGVRKISESAECNVGSLSSLIQAKHPSPKKGLMNKGLIKLVLGFLAGPLINMPVKDRHAKAKSLINLELFDSTEPVDISYRLILLDNSVLEVEAKRKVVWEKSSQILFIDRSGCEDQETDIEFVSCFAEEIAEGVAAQAGTNAVNNLSKMIQMGFMFGFEEKAVDFLLTKENLELFMEDDEFLEAESSLNMEFGLVSPKGKSRKLAELSPSTPAPQLKRRKTIGKVHLPESEQFTFCNQDQ